MIYARIIEFSLICLGIAMLGSAGVVTWCIREYGMHPTLATNTELRAILVPRIILESESEWVTLRGALRRLIQPL